MIRLVRPMWARVLSGFRLQGFLTLLAVLLAARAVGQAVGAIPDKSSSLGATLLELAAFSAAIAVGATGHAEFDETGVRWRYYAAHHYRWQEIERIELQTIGIGITSIRRLVAVRVNGRNHRVTPVAEGGRNAREFGFALADAAAARGIEVVDRWPQRLGRR